VNPTGFRPLSPLSYHPLRHPLSPGGIINWLSPDTDATEYRVRGAVRHPAYSPKNSRNDIALVFLDQCVALGPAVQPIKIATPEGALGWGHEIWV
jgi:hypothetical protein